MKFFFEILNMKNAPRIRKNKQLTNRASSESKFHEVWTFGGFGKPEQTHRQTLKIHVL